jgi:phosphoribosylformylglycinamidine cyclo-ligase
MNGSLTYQDAGVDIEKANRFVERIKEIVGKTAVPGVIGTIGGFSGLFSLDVGQYKEPVLVASTDGVGTKLKIAFMMDKHDTVGIDLVAMCVNDIVVQGSKPLFFLDYLSVGVLLPETAEAVVAGIAAGCRQANCALIGGETAEMPGLYGEGEYDLAGFVVGIVDKEKIIDGSKVRAGDKVIGIASSGLHSNGYSLVRKICFERLKLKVRDRVEFLGRTLGEELLVPTKVYAKVVSPLVEDHPIHGMAHITGGGIQDNLPRVLPPSCGAMIREGSWPVPPVFTFLQEAGNISREEMRRTFNNGIGMILVVPESALERVMASLTGMNEKAYVIGEVVERGKEKDGQVVWG